MENHLFSVNLVAVSSPVQLLKVLCHSCCQMNRDTCTIHGSSFWLLVALVADYLGGGAVVGIPEVFDCCSHSTVVAVVVEDGIEGGSEEDVADSEDDFADTASDGFDEGIEVACSCSCSCSCSYSYSRSYSLPDCCFDGYKSSERYLDNQRRY